MERPSWTREELEWNRPNIARMYDYFLGGAHNFAVDREAAQTAATIYPELPLILQVNRGFLRRAVAFLANQGIKQFLDIGSGIPTAGNVHEVAQAIHADARVVYVDIDPVVVLHSEAILQGNPLAASVQGDVRQVAHILQDPPVHRLLDFNKPLAVLLISMLHFVPDDEAIPAVRMLREALPPGSYLALTHASADNMSPEARADLERFWESTRNLMYFRSRSQLTEFFEGLALVDPGLVHIPLWRPDSPEDLFFDEPERTSGYAGVGRLP
jgi:S-adenosyl methyltransferase